MGLSSEEEDGRADAMGMSSEEEDERAGWGRGEVGNLLRRVVSGARAHVDDEVGREVAEHAAVIAAHRHHRFQLQPHFLLGLRLRRHRLLQPPLRFFLFFFSSF
jgi:hypothetical protein